MRILKHKWEMIDQKWVIEMPNFEKKKKILYVAKTFLYLLEVVFDLGKKELMQITGDGRAFAE